MCATKTGGVYRVVVNVFLVCLRTSQLKQFAVRLRTYVLWPIFNEFSRSSWPGGKDDSSVCLSSYCVGQ